MTVYTIYRNPSDYPGLFVVRGFNVGTGKPHDAPLALAKTLELAREALPPGLALIPRDESDDPVIVESWL